VRNRRRVVYYAILLLLILGELLGERNYIIIIFLEYDIFALMANISPEVQLPKTPFCIRSNLTYTLIRPFESNLVFRMADIRDVLEVGHNDHTFSIPECHNVATFIEKILTLLDSGTSNHCFITKSWFLSYNIISSPWRENSARKDSTFTIDSTGVAEFSTTINSIASRIKMNDALHTS